MAKENEPKPAATMTTMEVIHTTASADGATKKSKDVFALDGESKKGNLRFSKFGFEKKEDTKLFNMGTRVIADIERGSLVVTKSIKKADGTGYESKIQAVLYPHKDKNGNTFFSDWRKDKVGSYSASIRGVEAAAIIDKLTVANQRHFDQLEKDAANVKPDAPAPTAKRSMKPK